MPGSLFREWKVALAFVAGIAVLAGAFVSEEGEHRLFTQFQPRGNAAPETDQVPAAAVPAPSTAPAAPQGLGQFSSDEELEGQFADPEDPAVQPSLAATAAPDSGSGIAGGSQVGAEALNPTDQSASAPPVSAVETGL